MMENVLEFDPSRRIAVAKPAPERPAAIIIFPGVRYERRDDWPAAPDENDGGRKPVTGRRRR